MKIIILFAFGFGIMFHPGDAFTKGLMEYFDDMFEDIFNDYEPSDDILSDFLSEFYDYHYDDNDQFDDSLEEYYDSVQLPSGPSWLQTVHPIDRPQKPAAHNRPIPEQLEPPQDSNHGETSAQSTIQSGPSPPQNQQEHQVPDISANAKPIPIAPPEIATPVALNSTGPFTGPLILSLAEDAVDDTDGEGVLVGD